MSLPGADNFDVDADPLSSNWTTMPGAYACKASSGVAVYQSVTSLPAGAFWNAGTFNADQWAQATRPVLTSAFAGPAVRMATSGTSADCYFLTPAGSSILRLYKMAAGTATQLGDNMIVTAMNASTIIKITAVGSVISAYRDGVLVDTRTDSTYASGAAGIVFTGFRTLDNWQGGNIAPSVIARRRPGFGRIGTRSH
jgi:hypothetical protein